MNSLFRQLNEEGRIAIAPSVLAADFSRLEEEIKAVEDGGADVLHLDVMDGHFVENITFGPFIVEAISRLTDLPLITHLMISDPGKYAGRFVEAGSSLVTFHVEALENGHLELIESIRAMDCKAGIAINPDTPLEAVSGLLDRLDLLLTMTVFPGFGGQSFMKEVLPKIKEAARIKRDKKLSFLLEVDGGIKASTAPLAIEAGSQVLVAGTAVFGSSDYSEAIRSIRGG